AFAGAVEEDFDVGIAGFPGIFQQAAGFALVERDERIAEPVEGLAQRFAPFLVPAVVPAGVAAAVGAPALDAVVAAPGAVFHDLGLVCGGVSGEEFGVVGQA